MENGTTDSGAIESTQTEAGASGSDADAKQTTGTGLPDKAAAGAGNDGAAPAGAGVTPGADAIAEAYKPNFKFKVKDKELEFDDVVKPLIKTKDLEAKFREMYEKSHGIEEVKAAREAFKQQADEIKQKYQTMETSLQTLGTYVKKGDFRTFFQALNIPKEQIINYAIQELKYQELPPEQRAALDAQREQEQALMQASYQNQTLQQQMANLVQQQATFELNQELASPTVAQAISAYDARLAKPGAFRAEVIRRGQYYEAVHKISPPASQLVQEVLSLVGVQAQTQQGSQASSQDLSGQTQSQQQKPVISSFSSGGNKSPTRKVPTSVEDLRRMRQNL